MVTEKMVEKEVLIEKLKQAKNACELAVYMLAPSMVIQHLSSMVEILNFVLGKGSQNLIIPINKEGYDNMVEEKALADAAKYIEEADKFIAGMEN